MNSQRLCAVLGIALLGICVSAGSVFPAMTGLPEKPERQSFDVKVFHLWKTAVAVLEITPESEPNLFTAKITLTPAGTLKPLIPYKQCEFTSRFRVMPDKKRLRPEYFEKHLVSHRDYRGEYRFDYDKGVVVGQGFYNGKPLKPEEFPLPADGNYYDDFLSFVYNFRTGGYGGLQPGQTVRIQPIPTKNNKALEIQVVDPEQWKRLDEVEKTAQLIAVNVDNTFFGFHVHRFYLWLSSDGQPLHGLAKDVVGWGDIVGVSRQP